jgi:hypothetical protein
MGATISRGYGVEMRRLTASLILGVVAVLASATFAPGVSATANEQRAVGGCGASFELFRVQYIIARLAAPGFADAIRATDANNDGYLCVRILPNFPENRFDPAFVYVDNNA